MMNNHKCRQQRLRTCFLVLCVLLCISGHGQTLYEYIEEARQNNPKLKAKQYEYEITLERVNEAGSLPNTKIDAGYFVSEPETRTGAQKARFGATQPFPWFGTLKAKKNKIKSDSEILKNDVEILKGKVALQVKKQYYKLYALQAKIKILKEQKELLQTYKTTAITEVSANRMSTVDVLMINIAENQLDNKIEILKGTMLNTETGFNKILDRDGFESLVIPDNLIIPDEEPTMTIGEITYHPELLKYDVLDQMIIAEQKVNDKEKAPALSLGLDYIVVEERPDMDFDDNGKDIIMPMVSFSVPIFSKKFKSKNKQYELQKENYLQERESEQNRLEEILETAINNRITARINYTTQIKNISQLKQAETIALTTYQTGMLSFDELLKIHEMELDFETKKIEAIRDYFLQTSVINYLSM